MIRFFSVILLLCLFSTTFSQVTSTSDDYDCEVPPPLGVEPLTCCRVSKPFDSVNFPECFADPPIVTSTSTLPPIPVSEEFDDFSTIPPNRNSPPPTRSSGKPSKKGAQNSKQGDDERRDDDDERRVDDNDRDDDQNDGKKDQHHGYGHWPGKYHWGHDRHFHSDYHRYGRHRRQAVFRTNANATPNLCAIECIFNQTNILTNGRFDRDIAVDVYADYYPEVPIDLLTRTIDRCTKQLRNYLIARRRRSRNQINRNVPNKRCRNGSGLFAACFNREIYRNCPSELDTDSDDCTTLRSFIDNCSPIRAARLNFSYDNVDVDENGNFIPQDS